MIVVRERPSQPLGPEPYAEGGNVLGVAWARGTHRPAIELRNQRFRVPTSSRIWEGNTSCVAIGKTQHDAAESKTLCMCGDSRRENRESLLVSTVRWHVTDGWNGQRTSQTVMLI